MQNLEPDSPKFIFPHFGSFNLAILTVGHQFLHSLIMLHFCQKPKQFADFVIHVTPQMKHFFSRGFSTKESCADSF